MPRELSLAEIFQLGYYWETKILLTAVRLDVFSALDGKPKTAHEVAARIGAHEPTLGLLLNALVAMRLLTKDGGVLRQLSAAAENTSRPPFRPIYRSSSAPARCRMEQLGEVGRHDPFRDSGRSTGMCSKPIQNWAANVLAVLHRIGQQSGPELAKRLQLDGPRSPPGFGWRGRHQRDCLLPGLSGTDRHGVRSSRDACL